MQRLVFALKFLYSEISQESMRRAYYFWLISILLFASLYLAFDLYLFIWTKKEFATPIMYVKIGIFFALTIMYTIVHVMLNKMMRKMTGDFEKEKRSVKM